MGTLSKIMGNVRMTTTILVLVMCSIIGSITAMSASIYFNLRERSLEDSRIQQETNIGVAATILERRISGSVLSWGEDGSIGNFQSWAIPPFYDSEVIDSVTRVTKQDAGIFALDPQTQTLMVKTTSLVGPDGQRALSETLGPDSPAYEGLMAGEPFQGELGMMGESYFAALQPIQKVNGEVMGAIFVGTPMRNVEAAANSVLGLIAIVGGAVIIALGLVGFVVSRAITRPIPRLASAMDLSPRASTTPRCPMPIWAMRWAAWHVLWKCSARMASAWRR